MPTPQKEQEVAELTELLQRANLTIMTDYRGLSVTQMQDLRKGLRDQNATFRVVKNTLTGIAADNAGVSDIRTLLEGPTAIIFAEDDPVGPAKTVQGFVRSSRILQVKGGMLQGSMVPASQIQQLAELPSREVLLGKVVGTMQAPISGLVNVLSGTIRNLAYVLQARAEQIEGQGGN